MPSFRGQSPAHAVQAFCIIFAFLVLVHEAASHLLLPARRKRHFFLHLRSRNSDKPDEVSDSKCFLVGTSSWLSDSGYGSVRTKTRAGRTHGLRVLCRRRARAIVFASCRLRHGRGDPLPASGGELTVFLAVLGQHNVEDSFGPCLQPLSVYA